MDIDQPSIEFSEELVESFLITLKELHEKVIDSAVVCSIEFPETDNQLESAITSVMVGYFNEMKYPTFIEQVAALTIFIAKDHAFSDGNKRTAQQIPPMMFTLWLDGFKDIQCEDEEMYEVIEGIAKGEITQKEFTKWLINHIVFNNFKSYK